MTTEHPDWGRRLSDALRAAIGRNDLAAALALARDGDGQARSLASEFLLMSRGLGITVRVLLGQLGALTPPSGTVLDGEALDRDLRRLLADFRGSLEGPQEGPGSVLGDGLPGGKPAIGVVSPCRRWPSSPCARCRRASSASKPNRRWLPSR